MSESVLIFGAGGHAKVVLEILRADARYTVAGLLDRDPALVGTLVLGAAVLGGDEQLDALIAGGVRRFVVGVGSVGDPSTRREIYRRARSRGLEPVVLVHPSAVVSPSASLGPGTVVMAGAVINAGSSVGANAIVNTAAVVDHDCVVGDHAHLAPRSGLCGGVRIGEGAHVGAGATILQRIRIGSGAVVGAGAVVVRDVEPGAVVVGVPARPVRRVRMSGS